MTRWRSLWPRRDSGCSLHGVLIALRASCNVPTFAAVYVTSKHRAGKGLRPQVGPLNPTNAPCVLPTVHPTGAVFSEGCLFLHDPRRIGVSRASSVELERKTLKWRRSPRRTCLREQAPRQCRTHALLAAPKAAVLTFPWALTHIPPCWPSSPGLASRCIPCTIHFLRHRPLSKGCAKHSSARASLSSA